MFTDILRARLPLIAATTTDTLYVLTVVRHLAGKRPVDFISSLPENHTFVNNRVVIVYELEMEPEDAYNKAFESGATVLWLNPAYDADTGIAFMAGEIPVPHELVLAMLNEVLSPKKAEACAALLHGLTLKECREVVALAGVSGSVTPRSVVDARALLNHSIRGVERVMGDSDHYWPRADIRNWVEFESKFFLGDIHPMYRPRGLLFGGDPGTGKTEGAKYIAGQLGVPLFRLDLGNVMSKWQGESEGNLRVALSRLENESPCVMLLDEVEKIFATGGDADVVNRLLGHLLWWLQEHRAPVLTVMTTNDVESLPKELYRKGRVDRVFTFTMLNKERALQFAKYVYRKHKKNWAQAPKPAELEKVIATYDAVSHAEVDSIIINAFKKANIQGG